jgi:serine/threonine protein phosphatase PrpC
MTQELPLAEDTSRAHDVHTAHPDFTVQSFGLTDRGRKRATNEDQFVTATLMKALWVEQSSVPQPAVRYADDRGHLFAVADGVGGAEAGEKASALAVGAVQEFLLNALRWLFALDGSADPTVLREFKAALQSADACVYSAGARDSQLRGMGTTLTIAYSLGSDLFVAHAGDSRCYLLRRGLLHRLTRDDTLTNEMVENGLLSPAEAVGHELRHVITNVVGGEHLGVRVEVHRMILESGDIVLLCTDGLTGLLPDRRIASVIQASMNPEQACTELVRLANESGGTDNVTAVVARYS